jgi:hypothetical protein
MSMARGPAKQLAVCIENEGYPASLERRKIYVALRDQAAEKHGLLRVIDESGTDYLYPEDFFRLIELPQAVSGLYWPAHSCSTADEQAAAGLSS